MPYKIQPHNAAKKHRKHTPAKIDLSARPNAAARGYDAKWRKKRDSALAQVPLCWVCYFFGRISAAFILDHVEPHRGEKKKFAGMVQGLCGDCSKIKSVHEHARYMAGLPEPTEEDRRHDDKLRAAAIDKMRGIK